MLRSLTSVYTEYVRAILGRCGNGSMGAGGRRQSLLCESAPGERRFQSGCSLDEPGWRMISARGVACLRAPCEMEASEASWRLNDDARVERLRARAADLCCHGEGDPPDAARSIATSAGREGSQYTVGFKAGETRWWSEGQTRTVRGEH